MEFESRSEYERHIGKNLCPDCGRFLKKRHNHETGEEFMGCSNYEKGNCFFTLDRKTYLKIWHEHNKIVN